MSKDTQNDPVEKNRSLAKTHKQDSAKENAPMSEETITSILKLGRAHMLSIVSVAFAALAVVAGFYLWMEVVQIQKLVYAEGGVQDVSQIRDKVQQSQGQIKTVSNRLDALVNIDSELGRVSNQLAALQGEYNELRRATQERMKQTEDKTEALVKEKLLSIETKLSDTDTALVKMQAINTLSREQLGGKLDLMSKDLGQFQGIVRKDLSALEKELNRTKTQRVLAEVEHYLKVANQRITIDKEVRAAQNALESAVQRLLELRKNKIIGMHAVLQKDIAKLKAIEQPDIFGIGSRLIELQTQIESIPIKGMEKRFIVKRGTNDGIKTDGSMWDKTLASVKQGLKQVVHIRRIGEPIMPLLAPQETYYLYLNVRLKLEAARLALIKREQDVYRQSIKSVQGWTEKYLAPTPDAESVMNSLQRLAEISIDPKLPSLDQALKLLREHRMMTISSIKTTTTMP